MKLGIVGSGKIVQEFLPWLAASRAFEVAALCSTPRSADKAAALCAQYGVPLHTTEYEQLLAAVRRVALVPEMTATPVWVPGRSMACVLLLSPWAAAEEGSL